MMRWSSDFKMKKTLLLTTLLMSANALAGQLELRLPLCGGVCASDWSLGNSTISTWTPSTGAPTALIGSDGSLSLANSGSTVKGVVLEGDVAAFLASSSSEGTYGGSWVAENIGTTGTPVGSVIENLTADGGATNYTRIKLTQINKESDSLLDCSTNDDLTVSFDGGYPIPDGWDSYSVLPDDPGFLDNYYWTIGVFNAKTPMKVAKIASQHEVDTNSSGPTDDYNIYNISYGAFYDITTPPTSSLLWYKIHLHFTSGTKTYMDRQMVRNNCATSVEDYCIGGAPSLEEWPTDRQYSLSLSDNTLSTHALDGDAPLQGDFTSVNYYSATQGMGTITALSDSTWKYQNNLTGSCGGAQSSPIIKVGRLNQKEIIF